MIRKLDQHRVSTMPRVRAASLVLLIMLLANQTVSAFDLKVDIGVTDLPATASTSPNDVQAGFQGFNVDPPSASDSTFRAPGVVLTQVFDGVGVSIVGEGGNGPFYTDSGDVTHAFGDLIEDGVVMYESDLTVTLANLPSGTYSATLFHHWPVWNLPHLPFDVYLSTGSGETQVASDVALSTGFNPDSIATSQFLVNATGEDVVIRLDGVVDFNGPSTPVFLNGFTLVQVPEPSSLFLLATGMAVALLCIRRRR